MEIQIRPATQADYEQVAPLLDEVGQIHAESVPSRFRKPEDHYYSRDHFSTLVGDRNTSLLVAEREGRIYGYALAFLREFPDAPNQAPGRFARVDEMGVANFARREGIGRLLMSATEAWARQNGARLIELSVFDFNLPAIRLYQSLGYDMVFHRMDKKLGDK